DSVHFYPQSQTTYKKYQWNFGDGTGSTERHPWHLFQGPGTYIVCLTVTDTTSAGTCYDFSCDTIVVPHYIQVYPNPANSAIHFAVPHGTNPVRLEIVDDRGCLVYRTDTESASGFSVPTQGLSSGVYIYKLSDGKGVVQSGKFIVVKR
ncbi:MAG: PKD domain-containing protein, partial [Bacteroidota bacterium]|nr:PKD domain-containing protein [Bacteroidota bacterium]